VIGLLKRPVSFIFSLFSISTLLVIARFKKGKGTKVIFGTTPILSNKYWSQALNEMGVESETFMVNFFNSINKADDYDKYFDDVIPGFLARKYIKDLVRPFFVWFYILSNAKVFVMPFHGVIYDRFFWKFEYLMFKLSGIKTVVLPYGADAYMYSRIKDVSLQNALLVSYPEAARNEKYIEEKVFFWSKRADVTFAGFMGCDGMPRWDIPIAQMFNISISEWKQKINYSSCDGLDGVVRVLHSPNHRGFKGTEYLVKAVDELKSEGLQVELVLLEGVPNTRVRELMQEVDILAEQFIFTGYALSGIEGMASGLPVLANLDNSAYTSVFRRYSFLDECPILSTTPETLKENLRFLIRSPAIREQLGGLGRRYAEKYHSNDTMKYLFLHIFKRLDGEEVDLMNLFHPLKSDYVKRSYIRTPLVNNRYVK